MNHNLPAHVGAIVETICELGCERVNEIIDDLESGNPVKETSGLDSGERRLVLLELRAIMAVYVQDPA